MKASLRILYVSDQRFYRCAEGWYTNNGLPLAEYEAWLGDGAVERWTIFGRLEQRTVPPAGALKVQSAGSSNVRFIGPTGTQHGIRAYLKNAWVYLRLLRFAVRENDIVWVKANFVVAWFAIPFLRMSTVRKITISHQVGDPAGLAVGPKSILRGLRMGGAFLTKCVHRACDVNAFVSRELAARYGSSRAITWIVNESRVRRSDLRRRDTLSAIVRVPIRIIYVGRLTPEKRVDLLLTALGRLPAEFRLSVVGAGPLDNELMQTARHLHIEKSVTFLGVVEWGPTLFNLLREQDVLVLPSSTEGLPLVLIEAMSQGVLVIGTRVGGIPELIEHGSTGLLVEPDSADAIVSALMEYIASPQLRLHVRQQALAVAEANTIDQQLGGMFGRVGRLVQDRGLRTPSQGKATDAQEATGPEEDMRHHAPFPNTLSDTGTEVQNSLRRRPSNNPVWPKLTLVVTASVSAGFFRGQMAYLSRNGFDVDIISSPGTELAATRVQGATPWAIPMEREIAPLKDLVSLWRLCRVLRRTRPDLVVAGTPKAGLLGTLAARLVGVPHVIYTLHGLRLETASGWKRCVLWSTEWLACRAADQVRSVSPSLRARMITLGLVAAERCSVTRSGSSNGVDTEHWRRPPLGEAAGREIRERLGIPQAAPLVGFVGRLTRDKGIAELYEAFRNLRSSHPDLNLVLVGDFEAGDPVPRWLRVQIEADPGVVVTGFVTEVAPYYWAMDVLALPTYREGFPGVPLEAQAASVPVVSTDATGAIDAILDGVTGLRVPVGDVAALTAALDRLLSDPELRARMGEAGCEWVQQNFQREAMWKSLLADYRSIVKTGWRRQSHRGSLLRAGLDRLAAAFVLMLTAPLSLAAAIAIRCSMGSPVFFRQVRPGIESRPFTLFKFRTMRDVRDEKGELLEDCRRLTPLGRLLRRLSIDELPQLWNVLRGEMSLVGPRPLLPQYLERYTPEQARRHEVLPGITGWAQVNGRNAIGWEEKFALDVWYVEHRSPRLDLWILVQTLHNLIFCHDVSNGRHATMPEFMGSGRDL